MIKFSKETKVGVFAFLGIAVFILGYNFLKGRNFFESYNTYYIVYKNVDGIVKSSQVTINGMKIGQVEEIGLLNKGDARNILVTLLIDNKINFPKGTIATISTTDLLGTKVISISPSSNTEILNNKDTLVAGTEESLQTSIQKMVAPIKEKSEEVLVTLDRVLLSMDDIFDSSGTEKLANGINDFSGTLHYLRSVSERMDLLTLEENERLKNVFIHVESIVQNLRNNNEMITASFKNISKISDSIAASNLTQTINNISTVMADFSVTLEKINKGQGTLGKLANDSLLYINLINSSAELNSLLKDMQKYPGRYFSVSVFGNSRSSKQDKQHENDIKNNKPIK